VTQGAIPGRKSTTHALRDFSRRKKEASTRRLFKMQHVRRRALRGLLLAQRKEKAGAAAIQCAFFCIIFAKKG
jgi:hypothetical protein